jgi:hypothetical protein
MGLPKQGTLNTWSQLKSDLYLQRRTKQIHDAKHGGGDEPITIRVVMAGALGKVGGHIVGTD